MRRSAGLIAVFLVAAYLGLSLVSTACAVDHLEGAPAHHHPHHGGTLSHSSFCAWACQANPSSEASLPSFVSELLLTAGPLVERDRSVVTRSFGLSLASRAPPFTA